MSNPTTGWFIGGAAAGTAYGPLTVSNSQASLTADFIPFYSAALQGTYAINLANLLGIGSQVVSINDPQTLTQKTLDNTNAYTAKDTSFTLQNASSTTKQAQFLLSGITAGQKRIFTLPDYNGTVATTGGTETFTNKTLTAPVTTALSNSGGLSTDTIAASGNATLGGTLAITGQTTMQGGTGIPANGAQSAGLLFSSTAHFGIYFGSGAPTFNAAQGSVYLRSDGSSTSTRLYINTDGAGTWTNVTSAA